MDLERTNRAYRRALALGLTLAEIFVLLLFVLLLAFVTFYKHSLELSLKLPSMRRESSLQAAKIEALSEANTRLREEIKYFKSHAALPNKFDDLFRDLRLQQQRIEQLETQLTEDKEREAWIKGLEGAFTRESRTNADPHTALGQLVARADAANRALAILHASGFAKPEEQDVFEPVKRLADNLSKANLNSKDPNATASRLAKLTDAERERQRLQGELANLQKKLVTFGKGTEMPPCWASPYGTIEYIFDVTLTSEGIVVHDNGLPDHAEDEKQLVTDMTFDRVLGREQFLRGTDRLYQWSRTQHPECRFFVRVLDHTKGDEKATYKQELQTVEGHFYKLPVNDVAPRARTD